MYLPLQAIRAFDPFTAPVDDIAATRMMLVNAHMMYFYSSLESSSFNVHIQLTISVGARVCVVCLCVMYLEVADISFSLEFHNINIT